MPTRKTETTAPDTLLTRGGTVVETSDEAFQLHPSLLNAIVHDQVGTRAKAVLELVQNAIDSGSATVAVTIGSRVFRVIDQGRGFVDPDRSINDQKGCIRDWFGSFGYPHQPGDAMFGRFRIGRGQCFPWGAITWRSGFWRLSVDKQRTGIENYVLERMSEFQPGTIVEGQWYEPLLPGAVYGLERDMREFVVYSLVPITVNEVLVSKDPRAETWNHEDASCWIRFKETGGTTIYNQGIFVQYLGSNALPDAVIVSKIALGLNMARNHVKEDCPVWAEITRVVRSHEQRERRARVGRMTDEKRVRFATDLRTGKQRWDEVIGEKLFTDVRGAHLTWNALKGHIGKGLAISVAPKGDPVGELVHAQGTAFVLAQVTLDRFGASSLADLSAVLMRCNPPHRADRVALQHLATQAVAWDVISAGVEERRTILPHSALTRAEHLSMTVLNTMQPWLVYTLNHSTVIDGRRRRTIHAGQSEAADAWTDGCTFIAIERRALRQALHGFAGWQRLIDLLVHEYLHDTDDSGSHDHDLEFLSAFHEILLGDMKDSSATSGVQHIALRAFSEWVRLARGDSNLLRSRAVLDLDYAAQLRAMMTGLHASLDELLLHAEPDAVAARDA